MLLCFAAYRVGRTRIFIDTYKSRAFGIKSVVPWSRKPPCLKYATIRDMSTSLIYLFVLRCIFRTVNCLKTTDHNFITGA